MINQPRKQHLIDTAFRLFNQYGYHATGIDWILQESGVSKATLYKHFRSKDELIMAVLQQRDEKLKVHIQTYIAQTKNAGDEPALAIFDALHDWFRSTDFFGCNFIKASGEFSQAGEAIHDYAAEHKEGVRQTIEDQLGTGNKKTRAKLSRQLALLVEGAIVRACVCGDIEAAKSAKSIAATLLETIAGNKC